VAGIQNWREDFSMAPLRDIKIDKQTNRQTNRQTDGQEAREMNRPADRWTDGHMDRLAGQTDKNESRIKRQPHQLAHIKIQNDLMANLRYLRKHLPATRATTTIDNNNNNNNGK